MTTASNGDPGNVRVGNAEREAAIAALGEHWRAGRLDPAEHEARTTRAFAAVTRADLDALFVDLPPTPADSQGAAAAPAGTGQPSGTSSAPGAPGAPSTPARPPESPMVPQRSSLGRRRDVIMALMPFICLALFAVVRTWLVWLLIPVAGILLYGSDSNKKGRPRR